MKKYTHLLCLTFLLLIATGANAQRIRVIYFQPLDAPKPNAPENLSFVLGKPTPLPKT